MPRLLNQTVWISFACNLLEAGGETASALPSVDQGKWDKHSITCKSHGFDFIPFDFFTFGSFVRVGEEVHSRICQWYIGTVQLTCTDPTMGDACFGVSSPLFC